MKTAAHLTIFPSKRAPLALVVVPLVLIPLASNARTQAPAEPDKPTPAEPDKPDGIAPTDAPAEGEQTLEHRVSELEGKVEGINEPFLEMQSTLAAMKRLKFSGYLQGRYEWHDDSDFGVNPGLNAVGVPESRPRNLNRFLVRRARFKATYSGDFSEYMLQVDMAGATPDAMLRDAEASLVLDNINIPSAGNWEAKLTLGQFKIPFGYETLQSSGDRELPERSSVIRRFFPGERDRGLRFQGTWEWLSLKAAVINGNFTQDAIYRTADQTSWKDVSARLGVDFDFITAGVSGYWGHTLVTTIDGKMVAAPKYERHRRRLIGADAQYYLDVPGVGGLAIKGEVILGRDDNLDVSGVPEDPCRDRSTLGWIATVVQNVGDHFGVVVRVDQLDPDGSVPAACVDPALDPVKLAAAANIDRITTLDVGLLTYFSGNLKLALVYQHIMEQGTQGANKKDNDAFTAQLQAKF